MTRINGKEVFNSRKSNYCEDTGVDRIVVHGGEFHADDVFSVAMALICHPDAEVLRINDVPEELLNDERTIVADIGGGKYDHHQVDAEVRENGKKYAACGLLFRDLKDRIFGDNKAAADAFEKIFLIPIEEDDNGGGLNPLTATISSFNPMWDSELNYDEAFSEAVIFAQEVILREVERARSEEKAEAIVRDALEKSDGRVVLLPRLVPWKTFLVPSTAYFVVYPSTRGGYNLQVVPKELGSKVAKKYLPDKWLDAKPQGCSFVHLGLFIAAFDTEDEAKAAAESAL